MLQLLSIRALDLDEYEVVVQRASDAPQAYVYRIERGEVSVIQTPEGFSSMINRDYDAYGSVASAVGAFPRAQKSLQGLQDRPHEP